MTSGSLEERRRLVQSSSAGVIRGGRVDFVLEGEGGSLLGGGGHLQIFWSGVESVEELVMDSLQSL